MKRALASTLLIAVFVSLVAGMQTVEVTNANFVPSSAIHVISPTNTTYKSNAVLLNCCVVFVVTENKMATYSLDGGANVSIINKQGLESYVASESFWGDAVLSDLSEGSHHLEFFSENFMPGYAEVYFSIETVTPEPTSSPEPTFTPEPPPTPSPEPTPTLEPTATPGTMLNLESFPTSLVIASIIPVAIVLVGLGLLVYGIKRK